MAPNHEPNGVQLSHRTSGAQLPDSRVMYVGRPSGMHRTVAPATKPRWQRFVGYFVAAGLAAAALGAGARPWFTTEGATAPQTVAQETARQVTVARPERQQVATISLPATVEAFQSARLYARVSGYVKSW